LHAWVPSEIDPRPLRRSIRNSLSTEGIQPKEDTETQPDREISMSASATIVTEGSSGNKAKQKTDRIAGTIAKLHSVLTAGEAINEKVFQLRLWALIHRRSMAATTDRRFIYFRRALLGGFEMTDFQWQDVKTAHIKEHIFPSYLGADLIIHSIDGRTVSLKGIDSEKARRLYAFAQAQEQAWREKNRIREIEELRAKSGGITLNGEGGTLSGATPAAAEDMTKKLKDAKELLDCGAISDVEFETIKARFLNAI
jgi:hypothetical protein